jgi:hypothetical protein
LGIRTSVSPAGAELRARPPLESPNPDERAEFLAPALAEFLQPAPAALVLRPVPAEAQEQRPDRVGEREADEPVPRDQVRADGILTGFAPAAHT